MPPSSDGRPPGLRHRSAGRLLAVLLAGLLVAWSAPVASADLAARVLPDVLVVGGRPAPLRIEGVDPTRTAISVAITPPQIAAFDAASGTLRAVAPGSAWVWVSAGSERIAIPIVVRAAQDRPVASPAGWLRDNWPGVSGRTYCMMSPDQTPLASLFEVAAAGGAIDAARSPAALLAKLSDTAPGTLLAGPLSAGDAAGAWTLAVRLILSPAAGGGDAAVSIPLAWSADRLAPSPEAAARFAAPAQEALERCRAALIDAADAIETDIADRKADAANTRLQTVRPLLDLLGPVTGLSDAQRVPLTRLDSVRRLRLPLPWTELGPDLQRVSTSGDSGFLGYPSEITFEQRRLVLVNAPPQTTEDPWRVFYLAAEATPAATFTEAGSGLPRGLRLPTTAEWQASAYAWLGLPDRALHRDLLFGRKEWTTSDGRGIAAGGVTLSIGGQPREIPPLPADSAEALTQWLQNPLVLQPRDEGEDLTAVRPLFPVYPIPGDRPAQ